MTAALVTGLGVISPAGADTEAHWAATLAGRAAIGPLTRFDATGYASRLAGQVTGLDPADRLPGRLVPQTDHMTRLALVAADAALADTAVDVATLPEFAVGVVTASSAGGFEFGHRELQNLWSQGPTHVSAYQSFAWFYAVNTGQISIRHGLRGPSGVLVTEQAGGLDVLGQARRHVRGELSMVVAGGVDGWLCPWGWVAHQASGYLSRVADPRRAYLPFAAGANGYVPGEGGALFVVESAESARARGAPRRYGLIAGYAASFDPPPGSGRAPSLRRAVTAALADAEVDPSEVDVVFADAVGVPELDAVEARALAAVFGPYGVPVTAPKTMTGRLGAGGAALDVADALLSIRDGVIPPTVNVPEPVPAYQLDLVRRPRETRVRTALVLARGHGGFNSALVVTA